MEVVRNFAIEMEHLLTLELCFASRILRVVTLVAAPGKYHLKMELDYSCMNSSLFLQHLLLVC